MNRCSACGAPIRWAITASGKRQPLDAVPDTAGNVIARADHTGRLTCRVAKSADEPLFGSERRYMPHAATCKPIYATATPVAGPRLAVADPNVIDLNEWRAKRRNRKQR